MIEVPVGTVVRKIVYKCPETGREERELLADMDKPGMQIVAARGGKGGEGKREHTCCLRTPCCMFAPTHLQVHLFWSECLCGLECPFAPGLLQETARFATTRRSNSPSSAPWEKVGGDGLCLPILIACKHEDHAPVPFSPPTRLPACLLPLL